MARIVVLTGERGVGKSTVCRETVTLAKSQRYVCGGIITLTRPDGTREMLSLRDQKTRCLTVEPDTKSAIVQGRFHFDPETLDWANGKLIHSVPCDLFVVDELGPLEMEREAGLRSAISVLRGEEFALAIVVVRPELVITAQVQLPISATTVLTVTTESRDRLPSILLKMLKSGVHQEGGSFLRRK
jgi:nucleoside-triphosphatase THEP1